MPFCGRLMMICAIKLATASSETLELHQCRERSESWARVEGSCNKSLRTPGRRDHFRIETAGRS
jgi:hypothetical protein